MAPIYLPVIDAHVHFWHADKVNVSWLKGTSFPKTKDAIEYSEQVKIAGVKKAIYVETDVDPYHSLVEAEWIYQYAKDLKSTDSFGGIGGIVCFAPIEQGEFVQSYLGTLMRLTGGKNGLLKGVRCLLQDPALDPKRVLQKEFIFGIRCLESFHLSFDICIDCRASPQQFPPIQELVAQCPRVQFILDHMGKPPCNSQPGDTEFEFWKEQMIQLSKNPNVTCKISGLLTELSTNYHDDEISVVQQLKPFIQVTLDAFGIDRIMYGGDWPMCEIVNKTWKSWLQIVYELVKNWSEDDKEKFFISNATRIYKLESYQLNMSS